VGYLQDAGYRVDEAENGAEAPECHAWGRARCGRARSADAGDGWTGVPGGLSPGRTSGGGTRGAVIRRARPDAGHRAASDARLAGQAPRPRRAARGRRSGVAYVSSYSLYLWERAGPAPWSAAERGVRGAYEDERR